MTAAAAGRHLVHDEGEGRAPLDSATVAALTPSLLVTVPEACAMLRVSRAQLYVMANKLQVIEMVHIGKLARIPRVSLEAYVHSLRVASGRVRANGQDGGQQSGEDPNVEPFE